ncbi:MAG: hypothetical protein ACFE95_09845 [Candidatus Hodarchaeota archaeon]
MNINFLKDENESDIGFRISFPKDEEWLDKVNKGYPPKVYYYYDYNGAKEIRIEFPQDHYHTLFKANRCKTCGDWLILTKEGKYYCSCCFL